MPHTALTRARPSISSARRRRDGGTSKTLTPFLPGAAGAAAAMLQHLGVVGQFGMDDQAEAGQVDAARRHIGGDADPGAAVAQRLQRMIALALATVRPTAPRQEKPRSVSMRFHVAHRVAGVAEDQRAGRIHEAQQIDHGALDLVAGDADGAIFDVGMAGACRRGVAMRSASLLVMRRQGDDGLGQGGREQQGAPICRRGFQDELQILAKAHVEHLVGFVQHRAPCSADTFSARRSR